MTDLFPPDIFERLFADVQRLIAARAPAEFDLPAAFAAEHAELERQYQGDLQQRTDQYDREKDAIEAEYDSVRREILAKFQDDTQASQREFDEVCGEIHARFEEATSEENRTLEEARWEAMTIFEASKDGPSKELEEIRKRLAAENQRLATIREETVELMTRRRQWRDSLLVEQAPADAAESESARSDVGSTHVDASFTRLTSLMASAEQRLFDLTSQTIPRLFEGAQPAGAVVLIALVCVVPSGFVFGWFTWQWIVASILSTLLLTIGVAIWLYPLARRQSTQAYLALDRSVLEADAAARQLLETATAESRRKYAAICKTRDDELKKAEDAFAAATAECQRQQQGALDVADKKYPPQMSAAARSRDRQLDEVDETYPQRLSTLTRSHDEESARLQRQYEERSAAGETGFQRAWDEMAHQWTSGMSQFQRQVDAANGHVERLFPDWNTPRWSDWSPAAEIPPVVPLGRYHLDLSKIDGGLARDERLAMMQTIFSLPVALPFPQRSTLLVRAGKHGQPRAVEVLQSVMLRLLTSTPPGKIRFTIIDPVGLGENFSAFMHLADHDEQIVSGRIWTERVHIEKRLADLTQHMENVLQTYLRNEFASILDYNAQAGEMAEPYRVLVIANFPANFSEAAGRRLASIVASGARCGVFTLMSVDDQLKEPPNFSLDDVQRQALTLKSSDDHLTWCHPDHGDLTLEVTTPPDPERFTQVVRAVGETLGDVDRVEAPFSRVVPEEEADWWGADSRHGIDVPFGRAGARKLQRLELGKGTSQHVLISGKTGSGKSTLLHSLITATAVHYSPDEVEFYLVDFKKGVEFKAYAAGRLPHARVVAIESEREFGLSVLERLDDELKTRGDLFRNLGVQDIAGFRDARPDAKTPRILLVIDEFQELFVEDDKIAQTAALLLDRLVRQGRAFGIHVMLGSQTLAGAYSLARATLGQMAVRIALQCSDADAHLILSEENTAARLLNRPGEAIYNNANGTVEGNHPFQVVWLPDVERQSYLQRIEQLAKTRGYQGEPAIVFEGNVAADPAANCLLQERLDATRRPSRTPTTVRAWLGAAVAIKDPTAAVFARQTGSNLLIVGQHEEAAAGVLAASLIGLATQCGPSETDKPVVFRVLDGSRQHTPEADLWRRVAQCVGPRVEVSSTHDTAGVLNELAELLAQREADERDDDPAVFLFVHNLSRFRDLRKADDDYSFSSMDDEAAPSPADQFAAILRDGPPRGIHVLLWCDTHNNASRFLGRQALRDLEMRVLFQMSATDSSNLIDSAAAAGLGIHRAVLYHEGQGTLEKFRPYGLPTDEWLDVVERKLSER